VSALFITLVVVSVPSFFSPLLLQATAKEAIAMIAKNFFIFFDFLLFVEIFRCLYQKQEKVTRLFIIFLDGSGPPEDYNIFFAIGQGYYF